MVEKTDSLRLGVVIRKQPGVTRWTPWVWRPVAVIPGAGTAGWQVLRREGETVAYHAATCRLDVHRAETEAYRVALSNTPPCVYVILRERAVAGAAADDGGAAVGAPVAVAGVTASPFDAQDYADNGEDIVEPVPMPESLIAWLGAFVARHHEDQAFVKRRRDRVAVEAVEDGKGDARVPQRADVYRSPASLRQWRRPH